MKTMDLIKLNIYDHFQCKGAACRRTCCAGWRITVGKAEYQNLKERLNTDGKKLLRRLAEEKRTTQMYGEFVLEGKKGCPLQSEEGLCDLQLSFGAEALPDVCASFPRRGLRYKDQMQLFLTPACERVLELVLHQNGPLEFVRERQPLPQMLAAYFSGKNAGPAWNRYIRLQEFCILLLQAKDVSLDVRMALLGPGLHQIDAYYKNEQVFKVSAYIDCYLAMLGKDEGEAVIAQFASKKLEPVIMLGNFLASLPYSVSSDGYQELCKQVIQALNVKSHPQNGNGDMTFSYSRELYESRKKRFDAFTERYPYFLENIMVLLFTLEHWASLPNASRSIWEQYMYACWVYSNLKFVLTTCMEENTTDADLLDICVVLFRSWIHNEDVKKRAIEQLHQNGCDTPAHMAMLVQAG